MSHHHDKCGILVLAPDGIGASWTNKRSAARIVARGAAVKVSANVIQMRAGDYRLNCPAPAPHGPMLKMRSGLVIPHPARCKCRACHRVWIPDGTWNVCPRGMAA